MMKQILTVLLVLSSYGLIAQTYETTSTEKVFEEFSKLSNVYKKNGYSLSYQRVIYKNAADGDPMLTDKGAIYRGKSNEYRVETPGNLVIQNDQIKMVVDSTQNVVSLFKTDTLFQAIDVKKFMDKTIADQYSFKRMQTGNTIRYLLIPKNKLEGTTEIWINSTDFTIAKIEMILPESNYFSETMDDGTLETPKLIITYNKPVTIDMNKTRMFECSSFIENKNNQWTLSPTVKGFTLHDSRITTK